MRQEKDRVMLFNEIQKKIYNFFSGTYFTQENIREKFSDEELLEIFLLPESLTANFLDKCAELKISLVPKNIDEKVKYVLVKKDITAEEINKLFNLREKIFIFKQREIKYYRLCSKMIELGSFTKEEAEEYFLDNLLYIDDNVFHKGISQKIDDEIILNNFDKIKFDKLYLYITEKENIKTEVATALFRKLYKNPDYPITDSCFINLIKNMSDIDKVDLLKNKKLDDYFRGAIIDSISDENIKLKLLHTLPRDFRTTILKKIDDNIIIKRISPAKLFTNGYIIAGITDEEIKDKYLSKYFHFINQEMLGSIIGSFTDEKYIDKHINHIRKDVGRYGFISSYQDKNSKYVKDLLRSIKDDKILYDCYYYVTEIEDKKYILNNVKNPLLLKDLLDFKDRELFTIVAEKLSQKTLKEAITDYRERDWTYYEDISVFTLYDYLTDDAFLVESLKHTNYFPPYNERLNKIISRVSSYYKLDNNRVLKLVEIFGLNVLSSIDKLTDLLNMDEEDFNKVLNIFSKDILKFDAQNQNDALNALIQRKFRVKLADAIQVFSSTLHAVEDQSKEWVTIWVNYVLEVVDINKYKLTKKQLIEGLMNRDSNITSIYNKMTNEYLDILRAKFDVEEKGIAQLKFNDVIPDKNAVTKYIFEYVDEESIIKEIERFFIKERNKHQLNREELELLNNKELLVQIIKYRKHPEEYKEVSVEIKKNIKNINNIIYLMTDKGRQIPNVKLEKKVKENDKASIVQILCNINFKQLKNIILSDEELYNKLLNYLKSKKLISWVGRYDSLFEEADIEVSPSVIATLITCFNEIESFIEKEGPKATVTAVLDYANCYDINSKNRRLLLGKEDYNLIKRNPPPYSGSLKSEERLDLSLEYMKQMHERTGITVPTSDNIYNISNDKKIKITVGDIHNVNNLTLGERTGACMRMGGAADSLFQTCLLNENAFHIKFFDPDTEELISRVSCFRNGNTLFLNQLRHSLSNKYNDSELIEGLEKAAKYIINQTKDSKRPIENVVISKGYAMENDERQEVNLGVENIKKGFDMFYSDVFERAVIVATSNPDNSLVPVKLGNNGLPNYKPLRGKITKHYGKDAINAKAQILLLNELYKGNNIDELDLTLDNDIIYCITGEDWYISLNTEGKIETYLMETSNDKELAEKEINKYLEVLNEYTSKYDIEEIKSKMM